MHAAKVMEWIEDTLQQFNTELGTAYSDAVIGYRLGRN